MKPISWIMLSLAVLVAFLATYVLWKDWPTGEADWGLAGQKGDYWGGHAAAAGSLISALLFFVAIMLQKEELQSQREELKLTREEMTQARAVSTTQAQQLTRQTEIAEDSATVNSILEVISLRSRFEGELAGLRRIAADDDHRVLTLRHQLERTIPYLVMLLESVPSKAKQSYLAAAANALPYVVRSGNERPGFTQKTPNVDALEGMLADVTQLADRAADDPVGVQIRAGELLMIAMRPEYGLFREGKYAPLWSTIEVAHNATTTGTKRVLGQAVFLVAVSWWIQELRKDPPANEVDRATLGLNRMQAELEQRIALLNAINARPIKDSSNDPTWFVDWKPPISPATPTPESA